MESEYIIYKIGNDIGNPVTDNKVSEKCRADQMTDYSLNEIGRKPQEKPSLSIILKITEV